VGNYTVYASSRDSREKAVVQDVAVAVFGGPDDEGGFSVLPAAAGLIAGIGS
jgi:hypothetical protein